MCEANGAAHLPGQAIPDTAAANRSLTRDADVEPVGRGCEQHRRGRLCPTVIAHPETPVQGPLQRTIFAPAFGIGVSVTSVPAFQVVVQLCAQSRPGTSASTRPGAGDRQVQRGLAVELDEPRSVLQIRPGS